MPFILFLVGVPMVVLGRLRFGSFSQSGPEVRAAGVLLMLPFAASLLFSVLLMPISVNWTAESRRSFVNLLSLAQLVGQVGAMLAAWLVLRKGNKSGSAAPLAGPGILRQLERLSEVARREVQARPSQQRQIHPNVTDFPSVMNTRQAAAYLQVPEQTVLELIASGKLIAARINHRYTIARSVLDEYRNSQGATS